MNNYKKLCLILALTILFIFSISEKKTYALSMPYLTLCCEEDIVTSNNAILNVKFNNVEKVHIEAFEITISNDDTEIMRYRKTVPNVTKDTMVTFNIVKDTKKELEPNKIYKYIISAVTKENINLSMYTATHHFRTHSVKINVVEKKEKLNTAILKVKIDNPNRECIKKIGVKILKNKKVVSDFCKTINQTEEKMEYLFDIKADAKYTLRQNTQYNYIVYTEIDVSQSYLYTAVEECEGNVKTLSKPKVKTSIKNYRKTVRLNIKINNPNLKKVSKVKVLIKGGKKKCVVYCKAMDEKKKYLKNISLLINIKKTQLKKIAKAKKYKCITYVYIGNKIYSSKCTMKIK